MSATQSPPPLPAHTHTLHTHSHPTIIPTASTSTSSSSPAAASALSHSPNVSSPKLLPLGGAVDPRRSPQAQRRSPRAHPGHITLPSAQILAQHLSAQLQQAQLQQAQQAQAQQAAGRKHSKSAPTSPMSRPTRDLSLGLAPLSTITPIDISQAITASGGSPGALSEAAPAAVYANGHGRPNGHANYVNPSGLSPAAGQHLALAPPAHIESSRSPSHSPRQLHPRLSPEVSLKPLSQLAPTGANAHGRQKPVQRGATIPPVQRPTPSYYNMADPVPPSSSSSASSSSSSRTARGPARRRAGSNPRPPSSTSSEDTETEVDSDSTFVPGRPRHQHSKSQPDLTALRSRLAESWANQQQEERRLREEAQANSMLIRRRSHGRKTPPIRPMPLASSSLPHPHTHPHPHRSSSTGYSSAVPQSALGLRQSPRTSTVALAHLTPITSSPRTESSADDSPWSMRGVTLPQGGMTSSEDADDDLESNDSPSSGSLSFSPKHRRRQRLQAEKRSSGGSGSGSGSGPGTGPGPALGLLLEPNSADERAAQGRIDLRAASIEARLRRSSLLNFRLLAVVPALWGISVLTHAMITGALWHDVWPWGVDVSREALERLVQGSHVYQGIERPVHRGDMFLAICWVSVCVLVWHKFCREVVESSWLTPRPWSPRTSASASRPA